MMNGKSFLSNGNGKAPMPSGKRLRPNGNGNAPMASSAKRKKPSTSSSSSSEKQYAVELHFNTDLSHQFHLPTGNITSKILSQGWEPCIFLVKLPKVDPHLQSPPVIEYRNLCENFAATHQRFPISFSSSSLTIKSRGVNGHSFFLAPIPSMPLLNIYEEFLSFMSDICMESWVPLCPIALDVPDDKLVQAVNFLLSSTRFPLEGIVESIVLAEFSSSKRIPLYSFNFRTHPRSPRAEPIDDD